MDFGRRPHTVLWSAAHMTMRSSGLEYCPSETNFFGMSPSAKRRLKENNKNSWTLTSFLSETTFHGVRYLAPGAGAGSFAQLLWAACVLASAGGAACIIYLNVSEWRESPVLVSAVESGRIKGWTVQ